MPLRRRARKRQPTDDDLIELARRLLQLRADQRIGPVWMIGSFVYIAEPDALNPEMRSARCYRLDLALRVFCNGCRGVSRNAR